MDCYHAYRPMSGYSPVPYFLLCRAMELALKAHHLENKSRMTVKKDYSHNLSKLYSDLPSDLKFLDADQEKLLRVASDKYDVPNKGLSTFQQRTFSLATRHFPTWRSLQR